MVATIGPAKHLGALLRAVLVLAACAPLRLAEPLLAQEQLDAWREARRIDAHAGAVGTLAFSSDGKLLVTGSYDTTVRLWEVTSGKALRAFGGHAHPVSSVSLSRNGATLATGTQEPSMRLWRVCDAKLVCGPIVVGELGKLAAQVGLNADGRIVASNGDGDEVRLFRASDGGPLGTLRGHKRFVMCLAFSPDGKLLASGAADATVRIWSLSDRRALQVLNQHTGRIRTLAFSRDAQVLASGDEGGTVNIWQTRDWKPVRKLWYGNPVLDLAFSADGSVLAICSRSDVVPNASLRLWRVSDGKQVQVLMHELTEAICVAFSPDSKMLAAGCTDGTIRFFTPQPAKP